jgi:hypothetical protein
VAPVLTLRFEPDWAEVEGVRQRSVAFLREQGFEADVVDAVSMVACELTENAVKYGHFHDGAEAIGVTLTCAPKAVTVEVQSPVDDSKGIGVTKLDYMIQWIRGHQDPFEAYLGRLKEVSAQHMTSPESGLGLVRIAYEGHSILDFYVDNRNILFISAVYPLDAAPGAAS